MKKLKARNPPLRKPPAQTPRGIIQVKTRDNAEWFKPQTSMLAKRYRCDFTLPNDGGPGSQLFDVSTLDLWDNGGILCLISPGNVAYYPTNPSGLPAGSIWNDGLVCAVVPPTTPNPYATPIIWPNITALGLLSLGGKDLPLTMPLVPGQLWNDNGWVAIAPPAVLAADFWNDGDVLAFMQPGDAYAYPTSPAGLSPGSLWNNGLTVGVVGPTSPDPNAPPIVWPAVSAAGLLALTGANLPTWMPQIPGQLWNDGGVVAIATSTVAAGDFWNDGGVVVFSQTSTAPGYPTSPTGLLAGALWNNGLTVAVVGPTTPDPHAPPILWPAITAAELLAIGGANLPNSLPSTPGQLWNDSGTVVIALPYP